MNYRFLSTVLVSVVYRSGKRSFKTATMSVSPISNEVQDFELEKSTDPVQLENFSEQSFCSDSISIDAPQEQETLIDAAPRTSGEGAQLSKRAVKRVHW